MSILMMLLCLLLPHYSERQVRCIDADWRPIS